MNETLEEVKERLLKKVERGEMTAVQAFEEYEAISNMDSTLDIYNQ